MSRKRTLDSFLGLTPPPPAKRQELEPNSYLEFHMITADVSVAYRVYATALAIVMEVAPDIANPGSHTDVVHLALMYAAVRINGANPASWDAFYQLWVDTLGGREGCHPALVDRAKDLLVRLLERRNSMIMSFSAKHFSYSDTSIIWLDDTGDVARRLSMEDAIFDIEYDYDTSSPDSHPESPRSSGVCSDSD